MITEEEYKTIKEVEEIIDIFIKSKYCTRLTVPKLKELQKIYEREVKHKINIFCGSCVLTLCKVMKSKLLDYEKNRTVVEKESDNNNIEGIKSTDTSAKGKGRRSKKTSGQKQDIVKNED